MAKKKKVAARSPTDETVIQHTIRVPVPLEERVSRAMFLEGLRTYNDFVLSALTRRCRQVEQDHGIDPTAAAPRSR